MLIGAASALIGCSNPFGEKIPTPWSKTEGREEVVGSPTRADDEPVDEGVIRGVDQDRTGSNLIAEPNVIEVRPDVGSDLAAVEGDYAHLYEAGEVSDCPDGTSLIDDRGKGRNSAMFCALEGGVRHGPWISYHGNGTVKEIAPYVGGQRHGQVTAWTSKGKKESTFTWEDGQPRGGQTF